MPLISISRPAIEVKKITLGVPKAKEMASSARGAKANAKAPEVRD
jgi:hypothetical protein